MNISLLVVVCLCFSDGTYVSLFLLFLNFDDNENSRCVHVISRVKLHTLCCFIPSFECAYIPIKCIVIYRHNLVPYFIISIVANNTNLTTKHPRYFIHIIMLLTRTTTSLLHFLSSLPEHTHSTGDQFIIHKRVLYIIL